MATNTQKIIVTVAPVGKQIPEGILNPATPQEVASATIDCWRAGASMVHLHVRDNRGQQTEDLACFSQTVDLIRETSDILLQVSTGGLSSLSLEERCVGLNDPRVEMASLNMGSVNFDDSVYINTLPDIRYWAQRMRETNTLPEMEIFEPGMINNAKILIEEGVLRPPFIFGFALGFRGALPAQVENIPFLKNLLPADSHWGLAHEGMDNLTCLAGALAHGASAVRCGYEDGVCWAPGQAATTNAQLVEKLVSLVDLMGMDVASPAEAREILGMKALNP